MVKENFVGGRKNIYLLTKQYKGGIIHARF